MKKINSRKSVAQAMRGGIDRQGALLRPNALALLVAGAVGLFAAPGATVAQPVATETARLQFSMPAQALLASLRAFGRQTQYQVLFDNAWVADRQASAVEGSFTPHEALNRLLAGSGLTATSAQPGTFTLRLAPPPVTGATLPAVTIAADSEHSSTTEGTGSYAATGVSTTATGLAMTLRETPQSVSVVTQQQMKDRNMQSLDDVVDAATGLTYSKLGTERSSFYSRGFPITDLQVDGMSTSIAESYSNDALSLNNMAIYDRVEIVRGANGLMQGSGNPSAVINMVRKRPTRDFRMSAELGAGRWDDYRAQLDVSGPLNQAGTLRGRAVVFGNTANSFKDGAGTDNRMLYAIAEADLDTSTTASLGFSYQKDDHQGYDWGGLNTKADGSFYSLPRSASLTGPWAHLNRENYTAFGDITHRFENDWNVTGAFNIVRSDASFLGNYPSRVSGDTYTLPVSNAEYADRQYAVNLKLGGPFTLFGRRHELMLAASSRRDNFAYDVFSATNTPTVSLADFKSGAITAPLLRTTGTHYDLVRKENGLVAATRLRATDDLSVILGTRLSWAEYQSTSPSTNASFDSGRQVIPYAGVVYDLTRQHSVYASYTDIYSIQQYYSQSGLLDPVKGKNYEAGIKSEFFGGRLNTAFAVFQTDQLNLPVALGIPLTCGLTGASRCYTEGAKVRNRGIDLEVSGSPLPGWNIATGFTYSDPEYVAGPNAGKDYNTVLPRKVLKVSTDYQLPGGQWRVGGSVQSQSRMHYEGTGFNIAQGGYSLLNLHTSYQYNRHLRVQLNLRNALDKAYYQTIPTNNNYGGLFVGTPRSLAVTLRYDY